MAKYDFNPFTGNLDLTDTTTPQKLNPVTHRYNSAGYALKVYDSDSDTHIDSLDPLIVVDLNGDVVDSVAC